MNVNDGTKWQDRYGTVWEWSDVWGGYRAPGHVTHGIETLKTERGPLTKFNRPVPLDNRGNRFINPFLREVAGGADV